MFEISLPPKRWMPLKKLTEEQALEAVQRYDSGESLAPIASAMGVTRQSMWDLLRRRTKIRDRLAALPRKEPNATNLQLLCHPCHVEKSRTDRRLAWASTSSTGASLASRSPSLASD